MNGEAASPRDPGAPVRAPDAVGLLYSLDLGCGGDKKPGTIGVDRVPGPGVDLVLDLEREGLPLPDDSVGFVYSSRCFEQMRDHTLLLNEITRVAAHGARYEFWLTYSWHSEAQIFGQQSPWNEEQFLFISRRFRNFWATQTGVAWELTTLAFLVDPRAMAQAEALGFPPAFAIRHLINVVSEYAVMGRLDKHPKPGAEPPPINVFYGSSRASTSWLPLEHGWW